MKIRKYKSADLNSVLSLIRRTYTKFNFNEGSKKASEDYLNKFSSDKINLVKIKETFLKIPIFLVGIKNKKIVGVIIGNMDRIINLYVEGIEHRKGIGAILVDKFERLAKEKGSTRIKIRSSIYAIPFYQKMSYKKTTGIRSFYSLKFQPMIKLFKDKNRKFLK